jgi:hypothetical protein
LKWEEGNGNTLEIKEKGRSMFTGKLSSGYGIKSEIVVLLFYMDLLTLVLRQVFFLVERLE